jgi:thioredoxin-dependent peroxiredoxin
VAERPQPLEAGSEAPDFTATTSSGDTITLSELRGGRVALYFYPKDSTPGCTAQACNLRDHMAELADHDISVIGVSPDSDASHQRFAAKHELPFALIADPDRTIIEAYGVWGEKTNYGKTFMGLQRTTFLIDPDGLIAHVFKRPKTADHAAEIISKL